MAAGVALCLAIVGIAQIGLQWLSLPLMCIVLLLGMAMRAAAPFLVARSEPGVALCARPVLRIGVGLLGLRVVAEDLASLSGYTLVAVLLSIVCTLCGGFAIGRLLGLPRDTAAISATSVAICGASAALAAASAAPKRSGLQQDTALIIVIVSLLSTAVMLLYPMLGRTLGYDGTEMGVLFGAAIHDVAQVVGAGFSISPEVGVRAVTVKLIRIACLLPVIIGLTLALKGGEGTGGRQAMTASVPLFMLGFLALALLASSGVFPAPFRSAGIGLANGLLAMSVAAIGLKTSIGDMRKARPILLLAVILQTTWQLAIVVALIWATGI